MSWIVQNLWLIPALPLLAAGVLSLTKRRHRGVAAGAAIGAMGGSLILALMAFAATLSSPAGSGARQVVSFRWLQFGSQWIELGWVLDPLTAAMAVMVAFVGLLIFIYSVGYMAHDENFTRFFCFLALFAAAMLGVVIANSLLLFFICWELVGLASYLLIGFWFHKPSAAAAAKKAFITTRVGDIGFFLGILWLYSASGTLMFYDQGKGCLEQDALARLAGQVTFGGMATATAVSLLIFCGAMGKSGQVPLHVWLPDAMEGPTPVSALIHAATMVAAGVFLVARVYPLMDADAAGLPGQSSALTVVTWVGAVTAVFAALIAVAQTDIKRILAYSTVSQLGYMMLGLGVGGVAAGMFHLITHAFFKALLFMGAGSVIHGCHDEQDIRRMGGLKRWMPVTFVTYAIGMMALAGVPVFFAGFWSKDEILHAAHGWTGSHLPFYMGLFGAFLTAFYMTRQVVYVFFGSSRAAEAARKHRHPPRSVVPNADSSPAVEHHAAEEPHESPAVMTVPLAILAVFSVLLGFIGTPAWPWFQNYLAGQTAAVHFSRLWEWEIISLMFLSAGVVFAGIGSGWWVYGRRGATELTGDPLAEAQPAVFRVLREKFFVDELYEATVVRAVRIWAGFCDLFDRWIWGGVVQGVAYLILGVSWCNRFVDERFINGGFDAGCERVRRSGRWAVRWQNGQLQQYLRAIGLALIVLVLILAWGGTQ